jgi:hypothetical protein
VPLGRIMVGEVITHYKSILGENAVI